MGKKLLLFVVFFIGINGVNASLCDNSQKVKYQEQAKNINYIYNYVDDNNAFNILLYNVDDIFLIKNNDNNQQYKSSNKEIKINGIEPGKRIRLNVYTNDEFCSNDIIYTMYVNLPYYNPYYNDTLCNNIEDYKYCKKFMNKSITYEEFEYNTKKYINSLNISTSETKEVETFSLVRKIIDFYIKSYFIILPIIIITGVTLILIIKHIEKNKLF